MKNAISRTDFAKSGLGHLNVLMELGECGNIRETKHRAVISHFILGCYLPTLDFAR